MDGPDGVSNCIDPHSPAATATQPPTAASAAICSGVEDSRRAVAAGMISWLRDRAEVDRVLYPALPGDPGHDLWKRDFSGASGLFGVILKACSKDAVAAMLDHMELFAMGASWGGYESLMIPTEPGKIRTASRWPLGGPCLRLHIGLEDPDDLIADLEKGLARLTTAV